MSDKPVAAQGVITAINSTPTGTASSRSAVEIDATGLANVGVHVTGTYTAASGLTAQVSVTDGVWVSLAASTTFTKLSDGTTAATIASAATGAYVVSVVGAKKFRITSTGAVTGSAQIDLQGAGGGGGGGSGSGGGGAVTIASGADVDNAAMLALIGAPSTGTQSIVASSASDVTILASNASRKGAYVYNDSTQVLYLLLANATSSATVFTQKMAAGDAFSLAPGSYTGIIKGIWASANGNARVTEWT